MTKFDYYTAPPQEVFENIKLNAIRLWRTFDDTYWYATEKINGIKDMANIADNAWYIIAMFDQGNQEILIYMLDAEARVMVFEMLEKSNNF